MDQWTENQNRAAAGTAQLTALVMNLFRKEGSRPVEAVDLLPFPPPQKYLSEKESEEALDRFFTGYLHRTEMKNGH